MRPNPYAQQKKKTREDLVLEHAYVIKHIVNRMAARLPPGVDRDELHQAGALGLLDAAEKFDSKKDVQFRTYAEFRIKGAILDELRAMDWIPRSVRSSATQLEKTFVELSNKFGREPTDREMASSLKMPLKEYHEHLGKARPIPLISLEGMGGGTEDGDSQDILEVLEDPDIEDPFVLYSSGEMKDKLADAIRELKEQEQMILSLYYMEEMNLKEIGEILNVSESRISQIRTKTIIKLRAKLKAD